MRDQLPATTVPGLVPTRVDAARNGQLFRLRSNHLTLLVEQITFTPEVPRSIPIYISIVP